MIPPCESLFHVQAFSYALVSPAPLGLSFQNVFESPQCHFRPPPPGSLPRTSLFIPSLISERVGSTHASYPHPSCPHPNNWIATVFQTPPQTSLLTTSLISERVRLTEVRTRRFLVVGTLFSLLIWHARSIAPHLGVVCTLDSQFSDHYKSTASESK